MKINIAPKKGLVRIIKTAALTTAAICLSGFAAHATLTDCTGITTDKGTVNGIKKDTQNICIYKGIPYAAPPTGQLRFAPPAPPAPWATPLNATKFGPECPQYPITMLPATKPVGSEDCLYLNVWQPTSAATTKKPVMVFIHGGGFVTGSGSQDWYEATKLANFGDLIVVTINYRLGVFGFLAHPAFITPEGITGNWGMLDQVQALKWVKNNIANFGGDPDNITIFGESAGGMSVGLHLVSPLSRGLFDKAISQSGPTFIITKDPAYMQKNALGAAATLGCTDPATAAACLRAIDTMDVVKKTKITGFMGSSASGEAQATNYFPMVDGYFLPEAPIKLYMKGAALDIPVMIGTNRDEGSLFALMLKRKLDSAEEFLTAIDLDSKTVRDSFGIDLTKEFTGLYDPANYPSPKAAYIDLLTDSAFTCVVRPQIKLTANHKSPVYSYHFAQPLGDKGFAAQVGVFHGAELAFIYNNFNFFDFRLGSPENDAFSQKVMSLWTSFARTGIPSAPDFPTWPPFDTKNLTTLRIQSSPEIITGFKEKECSFIENNLFDSYGK